MSLEMSNPVRVKMADGTNYVGIIAGVNEEGIEMKCTYKFIAQSEQEGFHDKVVETLMDLEGRTLIALAVEMGILRKCLMLLGLRTRWSDFSEGVAVAWEEGMRGTGPLKVGKAVVKDEQKKGLCSIIGSAMMSEMDEVLVPLQSPVSVIVANGAWESISSLVDEGQEKLFERWAQGL